jgi:hypothetical protein
MERPTTQFFRILLSILFIFSGISKIISLPFFDGLVAELLIGKDYYDHPSAMMWMQIFTRVIIAGEIFLGAAVLQNKGLKKFIMPMITAILGLFTAHLVYEGITNGFIGNNCGCFGDLVPMDNLESIIKNVVALGLAFFVWRNVKEHIYQFQPWVVPFMTGLVTLATLFLTVKSYDVEEQPTTKRSVKTERIKEQPKTQQADTAKSDTLAVQDSVQPKQAETKNQEGTKPQSSEKSTSTEKKQETSTTAKQGSTPSSLLSKYTNFDGKTVNLDEGEKLVCMFSLTCGHCQEAYKDLYAVKDQLPDMYLLCYGSSADLNYFFRQGGGKVPYVLIEDYPDFARILQGKDFPVIQHREEGKVEKLWDFDSYAFEKVKTYFDVEEPKEEKQGGMIITQPEGGDRLFGE